MHVTNFSGKNKSQQQKGLYGKKEKNKEKVMMEIDQTKWLICMQC